MHAARVLCRLVQGSEIEPPKMRIMPVWHDSVVTCVTMGWEPFESNRRIL